MTGKRADEYVARVEALLADLDEDDRISLLADLRDQLAQSDDPTETLGTPEEFVAEYRRSAGLRVHSGVVGRPGQIASIVLLSLAVLLLFSFGSQVVLAPSVVVVGWFLARVSSPYLRMAWMIVAGLLAVEFIYLVSMRLDWPTLLIPASLALVAGIGVGVLFHRTPSTPPGANHTLLAISAGGLVAAVTLWVASPRGGLDIFAFVVAATVLAVGGLWAFGRRSR